MKKWILVVVVLLVLSGGVFLVRSMVGSDDSQRQGPDRRSPLVQTEPARLDRIEEVLEATAEVVATNSVTIRATIEGPIAYLPWREGDIIENAGQKLVEIDRSLYRQEVLAAEAALAVAEASLSDLKAGAREEEIAQAKETVKRLEAAAAHAEADKGRVESLVATGAIPGEEADRARLEHVRQQTELASARQRHAMLETGPTETAVAVQEAKVEENRARLALARARLAECTINAPFAGVVSEVFVRPGDLASVREPLVRLLDNDSLVVRFAIPENQAAGVRPGNSASIRLDSMPGRTLEGRVERLYPEIDRRTRTRTAEAVIVDDVDLVPGLFARISVSVRSAEDAVIVPDRALLTTASGERVLFVLDEGKAVRRLPTTGIEHGQEVQIIEGVSPGEQVIVAGHESLQDGAEVRLPGSGERLGGGQPGRSESPGTKADASSDTGVEPAEGSSKQTGGAFER